MTHWRKHLVAVISIGVFRVYHSFNFRIYYKSLHFPCLHAAFSVLFPASFSDITSFNFSTTDYYHRPFNFETFKHRSRPRVNYSQQTWCGPSSEARHRVSWSTAALNVQAQTIPLNARIDAIPDMLTMAPALCRSMRPRATT